MPVFLCPFTVTTTGCTYIPALKTETSLFILVLTLMNCWCPEEEECRLTKCESLTEMQSSTIVLVATALVLRAVGLMLSWCLFLRKVNMCVKSYYNIIIHMEQLQFSDLVGSHWVENILDVVHKLNPDHHTCVTC